MDNSAIDKSHRYDRQLRLWGDHGQSALESAHICLINATATGTEILKNLVLPGIGAFVIVDGNRIFGEDIGCNFFLGADSAGRNRGEVAAELLLELNHEVKGEAVPRPVDAVLRDSPNFFDAFSIVVATDVPEADLLLLGAALWQAGVPLLVCRSYGMVGYMRLVLQEHVIVESHPDAAHEDLRLDRPFPALLDFCRGFDLSALSKKEHSHLPYVVILVQCLDEWRREHGADKFPTTYKEKQAFKELIKRHVRRREDNADLEEIEENFEEAVKAVNTALVHSRVPSEVRQEVFASPECAEPSTAPRSPAHRAFWIMARALKEFTEQEGDGLLPLRGTIPDMFSASDHYIKLQQIYRAEAARQAAQVHQRVEAWRGRCGGGDNSDPCREEAIPPLSGLLTEEAVRHFCKNAAFLRVIRCRSLADEYEIGTARLRLLSTAAAAAATVGAEDEQEDLILWYLMLRACEMFRAEAGHYPGVYDTGVEPDTSQLLSCVTKLLSSWGGAGGPGGLSSCPPQLTDVVREVVRWGAGELHTVAAFMGGAAAQEVVKVVTKQFVPFNNTFIYNAISSTCATYEM